MFKKILAFAFLLFTSIGFAWQEAKLRQTGGYGDQEFCA